MNGFILGEVRAFVSEPLLSVSGRRNSFTQRIRVVGTAVEPTVSLQ
jgi:hypothetical protein